MVTASKNAPIVTILWPFEPQSERVRDLFSSWSARQRELSRTPRGQLECHWCPKLMANGGDKLSLCSKCTRELQDADAKSATLLLGKKTLIGKAAIVMEAARTLPQPFSAADLVVACWKLDREEFGLEGHADYPDSNAALAVCYGKRGLIHRGLLRRVGPKLFEVVG